MSNTIQVLGILKVSICTQIPSFLLHTVFCIFHIISALKPFSLLCQPRRRIGSTEGHNSLTFSCEARGGFCCIMGRQGVQHWCSSEGGNALGSHMSSPGRLWPDLLGDIMTLQPNDGWPICQLSQPSTQLLRAFA